MVKRAADWLEKFSVAAMAVGVFQEKVLGVFIGAACLAGCMYLTRRLK
ncbi:hypothetical protein [Solidesulfovibrio sp. C21]